ncbi:MAG: hypothetical protein GXP43_03655 [bacterium]|nr:hypothetical protein [bacterium]
MSSKVIVYLFIFIGSTLGAYVPVIWGASLFSFSSVLFSGIGAAIGLFIALSFTE